MVSRIAAYGVLYGRSRHHFENTLFRLKTPRELSWCLCTGEDGLWESKFYILFQPQKWASNESNSSLTSSCASCGFLRSRLESQSWNSFNPFHCKQGFSRCTDSGKTPQLKTSKLAQNCGKTEVLHLQPSYGICWSHEIETLPPMQTKDASGFKYILLFFNRMILNSGRHTQPDPQSCRVRSLGAKGGAQKQTTHQETKTKLSSATSNRDKTIHCQRKHRKSIPPAMSQRNQHLTHAMLRKPATTTPNFSQQPCSRESCHSVTLAKVLLY